MVVEFCLDAVEEALARYARPEIFNTDQGSQFTSAAFTGLLLDNAIAISMDGRGSWRDNVFVERLWRSVKYEEVYLHAYDSVGQARASLGGIWTSITANGRIRVLLPEHRIVPTSTTCRCSRQPKFRRRYRGVTPAGLRPPCVTPRQRHTTISTGRGSTYRGRNTVSTKPATSEGQ